MEEQQHTAVDGEQACNLLFLRVRLEGMIYNNRFQHLQAFFCDEANEDKIHHVLNDVSGRNMTCLEYAVFCGNWKMACCLLSLGADPQRNAFDGDKGIRGLKALASAELEDDELKTTSAFLSLMEWVSQPAGLQRRQDIVSAITNIRLLEDAGLANCSTIIAGLKETALATQRVLHKFGLKEDAVKDEILCHVIQNYVWKVFTQGVVADCLEQDDGGPYTYDAAMAVAQAAAICLLEEEEEEDYSDSDSEY